MQNKGLTRAFNEQLSPEDNVSHLLSGISVKNFVDNGKPIDSSDKKKQIKMFTAGNRTDHFSESKVVFRLSLPENMDGGSIDLEENILESEQFTLHHDRDPHLTAIMIKGHSDEIGRPSHENNTDNKELRLSKTIEKDSPRSNKY